MSLLQGGSNNIKRYVNKRHNGDDAVVTKGPKVNTALGAHSCLQVARYRPMCFLADCTFPAFSDMLSRILFETSW